MGVAGTLGGLNPVAVERGGVGGAAKFLQRLSAMVVSRAVVRIVGENIAELGDGRLQISVIRIIQRKPVAGERVLWVLFQKGPEGGGS